MYAVCGSSRLDIVMLKEVIILINYYHAHNQFSHFKWSHVNDGVDHANLVPACRREEECVYGQKVNTIV